ncbi:trihelix transcription factor ASR3 isoform X1 [Tanacetum coccineum]
MDDHETGTTSSLRTRSKAAPDWTVEESLILVNEIAAIEADCRGTLSSFQKWKIIVENCNALEVNRNLNQCRRKWDSLLSDYKKIKQSGSKKASFNSDLFKAIERYVREFEEEGEYDTDPEGDDDDNHDDGMDLPLAHVILTLMSRKPAGQGDSLNLPDHMYSIYTIKRGTGRAKRGGEYRSRGGIDGERTEGRGGGEYEKRRKCAGERE